MLHLLPTTPKIRQIQMQTDLNLADFKTMNDALLYIDAMASLGASQEAKSTVCVLGNTSVGKSSLTRTLKYYCNNPTQNPKPYLTEDPENKEFIETKVLQIVDNVEQMANNIPTLDIKLEVNSQKAFTISSGSKRYDEEPHDSNNSDGISMTFIDFGGHSEDKSFSPLFMKEKVVHMICFKPANFLWDKEAYFSSIGTYLEMVTEKCPTTIFILVATRTDESIAARSKSLKQTIILDEIIKTSSANVNKDSLDNIFAKFQA